VNESGSDPFRAFLAELADGKRWTLIQSEGWEDFAKRLSDVIGTLSPRRRQALVMLMFALSQRMTTPEAAEGFLAHQDMESEEGVEALIAWLRQFRPPSG
jgi:hypothetical protein